MFACILSINLKYAIHLSGTPADESTWLCDTSLELHCECLLVHDVSRSKVSSSW